MDVNEEESREWQKKKNWEDYKGMALTDNPNPQIHWNLL